MKTMYLFVQSNGRGTTTAYITFKLEWNMHDTMSGGQT